MRFAGLGPQGLSQAKGGWESSTERFEEGQAAQLHVRRDVKEEGWVGRSRSTWEALGGGQWGWRVTWLLRWDLLPALAGGVEGQMEQRSDLS